MKNTAMFNTGIGWSLRWGVIVPDMNTVSGEGQSCSNLCASFGFVLQRLVVPRRLSIFRFPSLVDLTSWPIHFPAPAMTLSQVQFRHVHTSYQRSCKTHNKQTRCNIGLALDIVETKGPESTNAPQPPSPFLSPARVKDSFVQFLRLKDADENSRVWVSSTTTFPKRR